MKKKYYLIYRTLNKCGQRNGKYGNKGETEMLIIDDGEQENASTTGGEDENSGLAEKGEWPHVCMVVGKENINYTFFSEKIPFFAFRTLISPPPFF